MLDHPEKRLPAESALEERRVQESRYCAHISHSGAQPGPALQCRNGVLHEYRERTAADVPVGGHRVVVWVRVRRMRCPALECRVQTFRERVAGVLDRYQRRIWWLTAQVRTVGRELAGRASARLLRALGILVSRHTALRVLLKIPCPG